MLLGYGRLACYWWFKPYTQCATNPRAHVKSPTPWFNWASLTPSHRASPVYKADELTIEEKREFNSQSYIYIYVELPMSVTPWYLEPEFTLMPLLLSAHILQYCTVRNSLHAKMLRVGMESVTIDILHVIMTYHYFQNSRAGLIFLPVFLQVHLSLMQTPNFNWVVSDIVLCTGMSQVQISLQRSDILAVVVRPLGHMQNIILVNICIFYNQRDATYTMFFIIISALYVSGGISAHNRELIKLYVQPWVLSCFPAVYCWCGTVPTQPHQR